MKTKNKFRIVIGKSVIRTSKSLNENRNEKIENFYYKISYCLLKEITEIATVTLLLL